MGTKLIPGEFDAISAALPDEPYFVLLARDNSAPEMLHQWADRRRKRVHEEAGSEYTDRQVLDLRKCTEADACADDMRIWRAANEGRWRLEPGSRRARRGYPTSEETDEICNATVKAIGNAFGIPSQFHSSRITLENVAGRPLGSPDFNGSLHYMRFHVIAEHDDNVRIPTLDVQAMRAQGQIIADAEISMIADGNPFRLSVRVVAFYE